MRSMFFMGDFKKTFEILCFVDKNLEIVTASFKHLKKKKIHRPLCLFFQCSFSLFLHVRMIWKNNLLEWKFC